MLKFFDSDFLDKTAVDVNRECLYDGGVLSVPDHKNDFVLVRFWKLELLVESFVSENVLIELSSVLVFDGNYEFITFWIVIRDVENQHIILHTQVPDRRGICSRDCTGDGRLGMRSCDRQQKEGSEDKLAKSGVEKRLHINGFLMTIRIYGATGFWHIATGWQATQAEQSASIYMGRSNGGKNS